MRSLRLALLGDPVSHSRSPAIHAAALAACGIPGEYRLRRVDGDGLVRALDEIRGRSLDGANVTMPHKRLAADLCDSLSAEASDLEAVNTLVGADGEVAGWNTDVVAVRSLLGRLADDAPVMVLGAGSAAAAALLAAAGRDLSVAARRMGAAEELCSRMGSTARPVPWGAAAPGAIVVNATPLGMEGEDLPGGMVEEAAGLVDMPYGRDPTPAVRLARRRGIPVFDGIEVLVEQAAESFVIWTGVEAPREVMERAARG